MTSTERMLVLVLASIFVTPCHAQGSRVPQSPPFSPPGREISSTPLSAPDSDTEARDRMARTMAKRLNRERQAAIRSDAERLVKLAQELKEGVDKSSENLLSLELVRKAEEIERLAHGVKEKMKTPN